MTTTSPIPSRTLDTMIREFRQVYPDRTYAEVREVLLQIAQLDTKLTRN